jgi:hypothetical protein
MVAFAYDGYQHCGVSGSGTQGWWSSGDRYPGLCEYGYKDTVNFFMGNNCKPEKKSYKKTGRKKSRKISERVRF